MTDRRFEAMDAMERFGAILTGKAAAATSLLTAAGGVAAEQAPRLAEATLFHAGGYAVTMPALSMGVAILAGLLAILRPAILGGLRLLSRSLRR